jgi:hypothetical protein
MAFGSVSLIATALGLNETRIGEGNPVSNLNLLKIQGFSERCDARVFDNWRDFGC